MWSGRTENKVVIVGGDMDVMTPFRKQTNTGQKSQTIETGDTGSWDRLHCCLLAEVQICRRNFAISTMSHFKLKHNEFTRELSIYGDVGKQRSCKAGFQ